MVRENEIKYPPPSREQLDQIARDKEVYDPTPKQREDNYTRILKYTPEDFEKLRTSNLHEHVGEVWDMAAYNLAIVQEDSYSKYCENLVAWKQLTWDQIKKLDNHIWSKS